MEALFKKSTRGCKYKFLAADCIWPSQQQQLQLLVNYLFKQYIYDSMCKTKIKIWEKEYIVLSATTDSEETSTVKLYLLINHYHELFNQVQIIIQEKPPYIMVSKISDYVFTIQNIDHLSYDHLFMIQRHNRRSSIIKFIIVAILIYTIYALYIKEFVRVIE